MQQWIFVLGASLLVWNAHVSAFQNFDWAYDGNIGPSSWSRNYPDCGESRQSPININPLEVRYDPTLKPFNISLKSAIGKFKVENLGLNTEIFFEDTNWEAKIEEEPNSCYRLHQIHFHWGSEDHQGSEHTIAGKQFPIEAHIVMWNCQLYPNVSTASIGAKGLAVLSILFEIGSHSSENSVIKSIVRAIGEETIKQCNCKTPEDITTEEMPGFDISQLLSFNMKHFYRYQGSLTTPPCTQNVMWTIFKERVAITKSQLAVFRSLLNRAKDNGGRQRMCNNFRPVQPLNPAESSSNEREVKASFSSNDLIKENRKEFQDLVKEEVIQLVIEKL